MGFVLQQACNYPVRHLVSVHVNIDPFIGNRAKMILTGRASRLHALLFSPLVPAFEGRRAQSAVNESLQSKAGHLSCPWEGLIGGPAHRDMVPVSGDPVGLESDHYLRAFLEEDLQYPADEPVEAHLGQVPVRVVQPFVPVRNCAVGPPSIDAFPSPPCTQLVRRSRDAVGDLPGPAVGRKHQAEPEPRVVLVLGNRAGATVRVIVPMGNHNRQ